MCHSIYSTKSVHHIFNKQDQLNPKFNSKIDSLVQQILQKVTPTKTFNGVTTVNGKALAALAVGYVEAVNRPGALPDLDQGWQAVVRLELKEVSYRLVREHEREMEEALEKRKTTSRTGMAYGNSSSDTEWEKIYSQRNKSAALILSTPVTKKSNYY